MLHNKSPFVTQLLHKSPLPSIAFLSQSKQFNGTDLPWKEQKWNYIFNTFPKEELHIIIEYVLPKVSFIATAQFCKAVPMAKQVIQKCKDCKPVTMEEVVFATLKYPYLQYQTKKKQKQKLVRSMFLEKHLISLYKQASDDKKEDLIAFIRCPNFASQLHTIPIETLEEMLIQRQILWFQHTAHYVPLSMLMDTNKLKQLLCTQHFDGETIMQLVVKEMVEKQIPITWMPLVAHAVLLPNSKIDPQILQSKEFLCHYADKILHYSTIIQQLQQEPPLLKQYLIMNPSYLKYAPKEYFKDREFLLACIAKWGNCLEYCDKQMRSNLEICTLAVSSNFGSIVFVDKELQSHPQIVEAYRISAAK